jgi:mono/diheme cytochrome c family protein
MMSAFDRGRQQNLKEEIKIKMKLSLKNTVGTVILCGFAAFYGTAWAADATAGKEVYGTKCKTCHGADGQGNPGMAKVLKTEIKPLTDAEVRSLSEADIKKIVTEGKGKMKPVAVSGADLDNVAAYVKSMK